MTQASASSQPHTSPARVADLRAAVHAAGTAARIALLVFAAELALETIPSGPEREDGRHVLALAAQVGEGRLDDPNPILDAIHDENDEGVDIHAQMAPEGPVRTAWVAIGTIAGYAAYEIYHRRGEHPDASVENFALDESLDWTVEPYADLPGLDWAALERAVAYVREHGSKAEEGWGRPMRVEELRRAAGRQDVAPVPATA